MVLWQRCTTTRTFESLQWSMFNKAWLRKQITFQIHHIKSDQYLSKVSALPKKSLAVSRALTHSPGLFRSFFVNQSLIIWGINRQLTEKSWNKGCDMRASSWRSDGFQTMQNKQWWPLWIKRKNEISNWQCSGSLKSYWAFRGDLS